MFVLVCLCLCVFVFVEVVGLLCLLRPCWFRRTFFVEELGLQDHEGVSKNQGQYRNRKSYGSDKKDTHKK